MLYETKCEFIVFFLLIFSLQHRMYSFRCRGDVGGSGRLLQRRQWHKHPKRFRDPGVQDRKRRRHGSISGVSQGCPDLHILLQPVLRLPLSSVHPGERAGKANSGPAGLHHCCVHAHCLRDIQRGGSERISAGMSSTKLPPLCKLVQYCLSIESATAHYTCVCIL